MYVCMYVCMYVMCMYVCMYVCVISLVQALALIELHKAPKGLYRNEVYLLPKKMGKGSSLS